MREVRGKEREGKRKGGEEGGKKEGRKRGGKERICSWFCYSQVPAYHLGPLSFEVTFPERVLCTYPSLPALNLSLSFLHPAFWI